MVGPEGLPYLSFFGGRIFTTLDRKDDYPPKSGEEVNEQANGNIHSHDHGKFVATKWYGWAHEARMHIALQYIHVVRALMLEMWQQRLWGVALP